MIMTNHLYKNDLPETRWTLARCWPLIARRWAETRIGDRLCVVHFRGARAFAHIVQIAIGQTEAPKILVALLEKTPKVLQAVHLAL